MKTHVPLGRSTIVSYIGFACSMMVLVFSLIHQDFKAPRLATPINIRIVDRGSVTVRESKIIPVTIIPEAQDTIIDAPLQKPDAIATEASLTDITAIIPPAPQPSLMPPPAINYDNALAIEIKSTPVMIVPIDPPKPIVPTPPIRPVVTPMLQIPPAWMRVSVAGAQITPIEASPTGKPEPTLEVETPTPTAVPTPTPTPRPTTTSVQSAPPTATLTPMPSPEPTETVDALVSPLQFPSTDLP